RLKIEGDLQVGPAPDMFNPAAGVAVRVTDASNLDQEFTWTAADCSTLRRGAVVSCVSPDSRWSIKFTESRNTPLRFHFVLLAVELDSPGPFVPPIRMQLTDDPPVRIEGIDRIGTFADCMNGINCLRCR